MTGDGGAYRAGTVADSLLEPVFAVEDGAIRYANARFHDVFLTDPDAVPGAPLEAFDRFVAEGVEPFRAAVEAVAAGEADERRVELEMDHPEAAPVPRFLPAEARITPVRGGSGVVVALRNISERRARERDLERQRTRLEEFSSVVSHDLRNPLNVAIGSVELAQEEHDSEQLERAARAHDRMAELIEELLALGRVGTPMQAVEPVELAGLAERCWDTVATGDAELRVETEATIRADPSRLQQLLENLIRNAVEHAERPVTITVGALADGFYVADDGPGIPADRRGSVLEAGFTSGGGGSGLGLAIVRGVAEAHDWSVGVTAAGDGGARFEFRDVELVD